MTTNKLILAGQQLSNICYNIKHNETLPQHVRESMERCVKEWDEALRELHSVPKAAKKDDSELYSLGKFIKDNLK